MQEQHQEMTEAAPGTHAVSFFDVDGTLVWRDFAEMRRRSRETVNSGMEIKPSAAVADAFRRMRELGNATFICTGRPVPFVLPSLLALEPTGIIAAAGAYVSVGDTVVRDVAIDPALVVEVARRFEAAGLDVTIESDTQNLELRPSGAPARFPRSALARTAAEVAEATGRHRFQKFCTNGLERDALAPLMPLIEEHFTICDLQGGVFEFSLKGIDKGTGIACALAHMGHGRANTFAFGDSENDLSMAPAVETFVAMGNALPGVKAAADYVTLSAADEGVPAGLAHFGLI